MVMDTGALFYANRIDIHDLDSEKICEIIKNELNTIDQLEVWKIHKHLCDRKITIETGMIYSKVYSFYYPFSGDSFDETTGEYIKTINEKFPKELLPYLIGETII